MASDITSSSTSFLLWCDLFDSCLLKNIETVLDLGHIDIFRDIEIFGILCTVLHKIFELYHWEIVILQTCIEIYTEVIERV